MKGLTELQDFVQSQPQSSLGSKHKYAPLTLVGCGAEVKVRLTVNFHPPISADTSASESGLRAPWYVIIWLNDEDAGEGRVTSNKHKRRVSGRSLGFYE